MGVPEATADAGVGGFAKGVPAGMAGGGTAETVLETAAVVGIGGGMMGEADVAGVEADGGCAVAGFGRLRERWATGVDAGAGAVEAADCC